MGGMENINKIDYTYCFIINIWSLLGLTVICKSIVSIYEINKSYSYHSKQNIVREVKNNTKDTTDNSTNTE
jgi:hypothetical protein